MNSLHVSCVNAAALYMYIFSIISIHRFFLGVQNTHVTKSFIGRGMATGTAAGSSDGSSGSGGVKFDSQMLEYLVCPLSKTPLR